MTRELKDKVNKNEIDYRNKEKEYNDEVAKNTSNPDDIYNKIYQQVKDCKYRSTGEEKSLLGIYAALKGYDGIYQPDGNSSGHGFVVVLNRSKIITSI